MPSSDQEIIQQVLAGEKRAYAELVNRHKDKAMTLAMRMLKNRQDAEEALQDAFVRAFNALPRFEWKSSFATWFYRIVYNVCATSLSRRDEEIRYSLDDEESFVQVELTSDDYIPDLQLETSEVQRTILEIMQTLPPKYTIILTMFFIQEMGYDEIVEVTGLPLGTVKVRLFRGRTLLRNAIVDRLGSDLEGVTMFKDFDDKRESIE
ncbi:MAG: sigma-70 family RNA polymerase sigma factor [Ignavibacteriales bacterium]|nr:sigma-70 family RNA polymerase sigma factor [Ignavibacteriales bacterium]MBI3786733.1 sigma-70 family RNA polymerase sigma factor [Ignavibacteriales bacterium]